MERQEPMICQKQGHQRKKIKYFKFSEDIQMILQCIYCNLQDPQVDKKIVVSELLDRPAFEIQNFPPLKNQKYDTQIRRILKNFDKFSDKQQEFNVQLENFHDSLKKQAIQAIEKSKKESIKKVKQLFTPLTDVSCVYDIEPLRKVIKNYIYKKFPKDDFFQQQVQMKKEFEKEEKFLFVSEQGQLLESIQNKVDNLKNKAEQLIKIFVSQLQFSQETLGSQQNLIVLEPYPKVVQSFPSLLPEFKNFEQQKEIEFFSKISTLSKQNKDQLQDQTQIYCPSVLFRPIYTARQLEVYLDLGIDLKTIQNNTCQMKFKLNFQGGRSTIKKQALSFYLLGERDKQQDQSGMNTIFFSDYGYTCAINGNGTNKQGQSFSDFWKNDESILVVRINYFQKIYEMFDEKKNGYIRLNLDQNKIRGSKIFLGVRQVTKDFSQQTCEVTAFQHKYF